MLNLISVINNLFLYPRYAQDLLSYRGMQRWMVFTLYGFALLPFVIVSTVRGADATIIMYVTITIALIGVALGTMHTTLGLIMTLMLAILGCLNWYVSGRSWVYTPSSSIGGLLIPTIAICFSLFIYGAAYQESRKYRSESSIWILIGGSIIGFGILLLLVYRPEPRIPLFNVSLFIYLLLRLLLTFELSDRIKLIVNWCARIVSISAVYIWVGLASGVIISATTFINTEIILIALISIVLGLIINWVMQLIVTFLTKGILYLAKDFIRREKQALLPLQFAIVIMAVATSLFNWTGMSYGIQYSLNYILATLVLGVIAGLVASLLILPTFQRGQNWEQATGLGRVALRSIFVVIAVIALAFGSWIQSKVIASTPSRTELTFDFDTFAISSDGHQLLLGNSTGSLRLENIDATNTVTGIGQDYASSTVDLGRINSVIFSPNDAHFLAYGENGVVLFDTQTKQEATAFSIGGNYNVDIAFTPDGHHAIRAEGNNILLWDTRTGETTREYSGHSNTITSITLSTDGQLLASSSNDGTTRIWDVTSGISRFQLDYSEVVRQVLFSPDGTNLLTRTSIRGEPLFIWNALTGAVIHTLPIGDNFVTSVAYSDDGELIAGRSYASSIILWGSKNSTPIGAIPNNYIYYKPPIDIHNENIYSIGSSRLYSIPLETPLSSILPWIYPSQNSLTAVGIIDIILPLFPPYTSAATLAFLIVCVCSIARWHWITFLMIGLLGIVITTRLPNNEYVYAVFNWSDTGVALVVGAGAGLLGGIWLFINPLINQVLAFNLKNQPNIVGKNNPAIEFVNAPVWVNRLGLNQRNLIQVLVDREVAPEAFRRPSAQKIASDYLQTKVEAHILAAKSLDKVAQINSLASTEQDWVDEALRLRGIVNVAEQVEEAAQLVNKVGVTSEIRRHLGRLIATEFTDVTRRYINLYATLRPYQADQLLTDLEPKPEDTEFLQTFRWQILYALTQTRRITDALRGSQEELTDAENSALRVLRELIRLERSFTGRDYNAILSQLDVLISSLDKELSSIPAKRLILQISQSDDETQVAEDANVFYTALSVVIDTLRAASNALAMYIGKRFDTLRELIVVTPNEITAFSSMYKELSVYREFKYSDLMDEIINRLSAASEAVDAVQNLPPRTYRRVQNYEQAASDIETLMAVLQQSGDNTINGFLKPASDLLRQSAMNIRKEYESVENSLLEKLNCAETLEQLYEMQRPVREAARMRSYPLFDEVTNWLGLVFDDLGATLNLDKNNYAYDLSLEKISERLGSVDVW